MNQKEAGKLLDKYLLGKASQQEETIVQSWLMHQTKSRQEDETQEVYPLPPDMWNAVYQSIHQKKNPQWLRMAVAASIAIIFFGLGLFIYSSQHKTNPATAMLAKDIKTGKVGATLTLGNGKKIKLSDATNGALAEEAGVRVSKTANGQLVYELRSQTLKEGVLNILATAKGETYQLHLPDGSLVWLNAASSLTYAANLRAGGKRSVKLDGEGYFEIAKDKIHPFVVESKGQKVEVLGTHFNVKAYADEQVISTTLLEGSINIKQNGQAEKLIPGQQARNTGNHISISETDTEFAVAWKDNKFIFDSQHIEEIMRTIARWYDVEVIYTAKMPKETFWGSVSRFDHVAKVLKKLESTEKVHFKIEGRKIYVSP